MDGFKQVVCSAELKKQIAHCKLACDVASALSHHGQMPIIVDVAEQRVVTLKELAETVNSDQYGDTIARDIEFIEELPRNRFAGD